MVHRGLSGALVVLGSVVVLASPASALLHLWDIAEVFSNADGSVQFVELFTKGSGEIALGTAKLDSDSNSFTLPGPVVGPTTNRSYLIATPGFDALPGGVVPDAVMPVAPFFSIDGDTLVFQSVGNDVFDSIVLLLGDLPTDGTLSLHRVNPGGTSGADPPGALIEGENSPTNYAGDSGRVMLPEPGGTLLGLGALSATGWLARLRRKRR